MSILIDEHTRVAVQGITGTGGRFHAGSMREYGTRVVAGVSPGHGGERVSDIPVYDTLADAARATPIDLSVIFVGGMHFLAAVTEAVRRGIPTIVAMAEVIPHLDILRAVALSRAHGVRLIGPNTNGLISPGKAKVGFFPKELDLAGHIGVISRSGTLAYAALIALQSRGLGQSTVVGIGGSAARGYSMAEALRDFEADEATRAIVLLGEIGGGEEQEAAALVRSGRVRKPVLATVVGACAPSGREMGHAGALVADEASSFEGKVEALGQAGIDVSLDLEELARQAERRLGRLA